MKRCACVIAWILMLGGRVALAAGLIPQPTDPRLRELIYDPHAVVTVPVKRGVVTLVVLDADEAITEVAAGLGGDCSKPDAAWCVAAQAGGRTLFVKPKSTASSANNLAVVTDRRTHAFRFVVLEDNDPRPAVYRLVVKAPPQPAAPKPASPSVLGSARADAAVLAQLLALPEPPALTPPPAPEQVVRERLQTKARLVNTQYSVSVGVDAEDITPTLVFDDGRFTYLRFPGNRELPAVFQVLGDGSETLVNTRMEDDLLVVDRVSRRLVLRAGSSVVGLWNEVFDLDGRPPGDGTTVLGVERVLRTSVAGNGGHVGSRAGESSASVGSQTGARP